MDQVKLSFSLHCPAHPDHVIGMLNVAPNAKQIGYCYECIAENGGNATTLKTVSGYLKESSSFYEKCRQRAQKAGEPPAEYVQELSKKKERSANFLQHIDQEKNKVKRSFDEIRRIVEQIINDKEKECLKLLDKEISYLSEAYDKYENLFRIGWPKPSEIQNIFPGIETLKERMSQIGSLDQLQAFMTGIQEDLKIQDLYFKNEDGLSKIKQRMNGLIRGLSIPDCSFPKIRNKILNSENLMKDLMKGFSQQEVKVENSFESRMKASIYESKIINNGQLETLKDWLPKGYKCDLNLLFRGSVDGMSSQKFHEKCDGKGATITLVKCQIYGTAGYTLGGFIDQSWHSKGIYSSSKEAFLFSLGEQQATSVKCPILETHFGNALYGHPQYGPTFGDGHDFYIHDGLKTGKINPHSYSNSIALRNGQGNQFDGYRNRFHGYGKQFEDEDDIVDYYMEDFQVEEIEVFQVE